MACILVVDDEANQRLVLEQALLTVSDSWQIMCAGSVQEAIRMLTSVTPDLLITDYHISTHTGLELVEHIRAHQIDVPVILITADSAPEIEDMASTLGIDHHLTKPVPLTRLRQLAAQVLHQALP